MSGVFGGNQYAGRTTQVGIGYRDAASIESGGDPADAVEAQYSLRLNLRIALTAINDLDDNSPMTRPQGDG